MVKNGQKTVFIIHTSNVSVKYLNSLFNELAPNVIVRNIIDDSLLPEVLNNGGITKRITKSICAYALQAEAAGADLVFSQCSSVGEAANIAKKLIDIPLIKVDEKMAEVACQTGKRIGIAATLKTTLWPTVCLIKETAARLNKKVEIVESLSEGAFDLLISGDTKGHNDMVKDNILKLIKEVDVVVCAQGSMVPLIDALGKTPVPVLTSPRLGVERAVEVLKKNN